MLHFWRNHRLWHVWLFAQANNLLSYSMCLSPTLPLSLSLYLSRPPTFNLSLSPCHFQSIYIVAIFCSCSRILDQVGIGLNVYDMWDCGDVCSEVYGVMSFRPVWELSLAGASLVTAFLLLTEIFFIGVRKKLQSNRVLLNLRLGMGLVQIGWI